MLKILANRTYRHLFLAQVIALVGTGLATVALGLLAFDLAGAQAGAVLGTALAIKMTAYIGVAPIAAAFAERLPRRAMLVSLDLVRAVVALALTFVTEVWQIYVLIFVLQSASAAFTPTFQATIPDILPDEDDYTRALSLSRLAYDLESVASPMLAAALLTVISFHNLFAGTVIGFLASAALVATVLLPKAKQVPRRSIYERTTRGMRIFLATPPPARAAGSQPDGSGCQCNGHRQHRGSGSVALRSAPKLNGIGAGCVWWRFHDPALVLPRLLKNIKDRTAMLFGGGILVGRLGRRHQPDHLQLPAAVVDGARGGLFAGPDSERSPVASLGTCRRSPGVVCRPICAVPCLLVDYLSSGGMAGSQHQPHCVVCWPRCGGRQCTAGQHRDLAPQLMTRSRSDTPMRICPAITRTSTAKTVLDHEHPYVIDDQHRRWPNR